MKKSFSFLTVGIVLYFSNQFAHAQTPPRLKLTRNAAASVQVIWTNLVGTSYHVLFSTNLTKPFTVLEDAFSPDELVTVYASTADSPLGFFRIQIPTNGPTASVQIFSPSDSLTVSGEISVRMGAQLGTQVQGVNLYLDDALVGYLNSGGMNFILDTTHFANGTHTLYVGVVDTANNETLSSSITLNFNNSVRWLNACSLFNSFVPIDVDSDIFPADWLVTVTSTNGTIVRTITGSTTDGIIQTSWDGTDDNSQPLPMESLYQIAVDVVGTGSSSMMRASSLAGVLGATAVSTELNPQGVPEFAVEQPAADVLTTYEQTVEIYKKLTPQEKLIYPPLPKRPDTKPNSTAKRKLTAREMFFALHQTISVASGRALRSPTPDVASPANSGYTKTVAWWEIPRNSGKIVISRVPIDGTPGITVGNNCNQIAALVGTAALTVGNNRDVYSGFVQVVSTSSDVADMTNRLVDSSVTAFYFYGHGNAHGNVIGTTTAGVSAKNLGIMLGNKFVSSLPATNGATAGLPFLSTHKPFFFVFLDGCNTGLGDFPESFGIPKVFSGGDYTDGHLHKRAFMGWSGPVTFQFDDDHIAWSLHFWTVWLDDSESYDVQIIDAILAANNYRPSVLSNVPILRYGSRALKWSD